MTALKTALLFQEPYARPLSTGGQFQSACYLVFTSGGVVAPVYRDPALLWPYTQTSIPGSGPPSEQSVTSGISSDANGRFDPIYLNPALEYSYTLYSSAGAVLETGANINVSNVYQPLKATKISSTTRVATSASLTDPDLQVNLPVAGTYRIEADIGTLSSASQYIVLAPYFSGSVPAYAGGVGNYPQVTAYGYASGAYTSAVVLVATNALSGGSVFAINGNPSANTVRFAGTIQVTSAGTLSVKWGPTAASTTPLTLVAGSALYATLL